MAIVRGSVARAASLYIPVVTSLLYRPKEIIMSMATPGATRALPVERQRNGHTGRAIVTEGEGEVVNKVRQTAAGSAAVMWKHGCCMDEI